MCSFFYVKPFVSKAPPFLYPSMKPAKLSRKHSRAWRREAIAQRKCQWMIYCRYCILSFVLRASKKI